MSIATAAVTTVGMNHRRNMVASPLPENYCPTKEEPEAPSLEKWGASGSPEDIAISMPWA
jgi:hypothetical protein